MRNFKVIVRKTIMMGVIEELIEIRAREEEDALDLAYEGEGTVLSKNIDIKETETESANIVTQQQLEYGWIKSSI